MANAADAADPEVVPIRSGSATSTPPIEPFGEQRAGVDHERGAGRHVRRQNRRDQQPERAGKQQLPARETERILRIASERALALALRDHGGDDQADEHPADRADALHEVAEQHADAAGALVAAGADRGEHAAAAP